MTDVRTMIGTAITGLALALLPMPAWADSGQEAAAEALFQAGKRLMEEGKFSDACPKLEESQRLDPAVGTLLYLGECYEKNGQTASAWATFQSAAGTAEKARDEREKVARDRVNRLAGKLSKVTITMSSSGRVPGLEVTRDGVQVGQPSFGIGVPVDPGQHVVAARAPGKKPWSQTVAVAPDGASVTVAIPPLEDEAQAPTAGSQSSGMAAAAGSTAPTDQGTRPSSGNTQRILAFVAGGVGVAGIAVGTVFGLQAQSKEKDSEKYCGPADMSICSQKGADLIDDGKSAATISNVGFIVGGAGLVAAVVLYLTAPSGPPKAALGRERTMLRVLPAFGAGTAGGLVSGTF